MKPTTIKTTKTKRVGDLALDEFATIDIGGVEHDICRGPDCYRINGSRSCGINSRAAVTATETRPMTTADLQMGDCFRIDGLRFELAFLVWLGDHRVIKAHHARPPTVQQVGEVAGLEVSLVTPTFDAEPVEDERTVPVHEAGKFELCGMTGHRVACADPMWTYVEWEQEHGTHPLPIDTPVTVREPARYESWDDVSVGDVIVRGTTEWNEKAAIVCRVEQGIAQTLVPPHECLQNMHCLNGVKRARLTHVDYTPREEVSR